MSKQFLQFISIKPRGLRILKRVLIIFIFALLLFGLIGYFWLPGFAKNKLETALSDALKRPVTIERLAISPYNLSATIEGFKAGDVLSVGSLYVNVSYTSLLRMIPVIQELRVDAPRVHLVRESENRLNISDLLDSKSGGNNSPPPQFVVNNISVSNGQVEWVDKVVGKTQILSDMHLGVPFIANVPSQVQVFVKPMFRAKLNGAPLELSGEMRPFANGHDATVEITLDGLDIMPVASYVKLPVTLKSALLDTRLQVQFQHSAGHASELSVTGNLALRNIQGELAAQKLAFDVPMFAVQDIHANVFAEKISIAEVAVKSNSHDAVTANYAHETLAQIGEFKLGKIVLDMHTHRAEVGDVELNDAEFMLRRNAQGSMNVLDLAKSFSSPHAPENKNTVATPAWHWSVGNVAVVSGKLHYADAAIANQKMDVTNLALRLGKLSSEEQEVVPLTLNSNINEHGSLAASGTVALDGKADLKMELSKLDLPALQGWATDNLNALLTRGDLSFSGNVHAAHGVADVNGDVTLNNFNVLDRVNAEDMLSWKQLKLNKLAVHSQPLAIDIGEVSLRNFFAQLLINSKGQLNLKGLMKDTPEKAASAQAAASSVVATSAPIAIAGKTDKSALPIRVGKITLSGGNIDFTDNFIKPNYSAQLFDLNGHVGRLAAGTQSPVEISGKIDRTAPLAIAGTVDPFSLPISLNIQAAAKGIDLPNLSSYSEHYLGYAIEKGKLFVEVNYHIDKGELTAENKIFLDQLTLGEKVDSPSAMNIPIRLAISLLQNSRGEINLDLPIRGSLNDPQFSLGGIVFDVIVNFMVKAVTSPFALLGSMFGGSEDISHVVFAPGYSTVTAESEKRLLSISKAMADRPGMKIEITGFADPVIDRDGLKHAMLARKINAAKLAEQSKQNKGRGALEETTVTPEEYPVYLEQVYSSEHFSGKPRNAIGLAKTLPPADMEALLLAHFEVSDDDLAELADARGQAAESWLTEQGGVTVDRIFLLSSHVAPAEKDAPGSQAKFSLR